MKNLVSKKCIFNQFFAISVTILLITGCTSTDSDKAGKLIKQYAKANIADYKSFEIIQIDSIKPIYSNLLEEKTIIGLCNRYIFFSDSINALEIEKYSVDEYLKESNFNLRRLYRQYQTTSWDLLTSFSSSNVSHVLNTARDGATLEDAMQLLQQNINEAELYKNSIMKLADDFSDSLYTIRQRASNYCNSYVPKYLGKETVVKCRYKGEDGNMKVESYRVIMDDQLSSIVSLENVKEKSPVSKSVQDFVCSIIGNVYEYNQSYTDSDNEDLLDEKRGQSSLSSQYVVIDGTDLRLRLGPSTNSDTFKWGDGSNRHPNKGERYRYLGESGDFYKIDYKGNELWVSKQYTHLE